MASSVSCSWISWLLTLPKRKGTWNRSTPRYSRRYTPAFFSFINMSQSHTVSATLSSNVETKPSTPCLGFQNLQYSVCQLLYIGGLVNESGGTPPSGAAWSLQVDFSQPLVHTKQMQPFTLSSVQVQKIIMQTHHQALWVEGLTSAASSGTFSPHFLSEMGLSQCSTVLQ